MKKKKKKKKKKHFSFSLNEFPHQIKVNQSVASFISPFSAE